MPNLNRFAENVWIMDGPDVRDLGILFTTRMSVVKLSTGSLWLSSPVPASFADLERITDLGQVRYLIAATPRHVWRLQSWHTLFPEAELWTARTTVMTLKKGRLPLTGILGDAPPPAWADDIDQLAFRGNPLIEEVIFFHKASRTVLLDDLIQNHPLTPGRPFFNALIRLAGLAYPYGGVPLDGRLTFIHRDLARRSLEKLLSWDFDRLILGHGVCVETGARAFVERAFRWLTNPRSAHHGADGTLRT